MTTPQIETGIPLPPGHYLGKGITAMLRKIMGKLEVGDSFVFTTLQTPFKVAKDIGIVITTTKLEDGGFRIWRKS